MITYKNTNSNVGSLRIDGLQQLTNFNSKVRKAKIERSKPQVDQEDFETIVLELMSTLREQAETSHSDTLDQFFKLLMNQLAEKNPNLEEILNLINNTRV
jgi:flagellin-specific chaperone FliS